MRWHCSCLLTWCAALDLWNLSPDVMDDSHRKRVFPCQGDSRCGAERSAVNLISPGTLLGTGQFLSYARLSELRLFGAS